jgi:acid phosphatase (class A)
MRHFYLAGTLLFLLLPLSSKAKSKESSLALSRDANHSTISTYFIDPSILDVASTLTAPPASGSQSTQEELAVIHHVELTRTPQQVIAAREDDREQDIFIFRNVLGSGFKADRFPLAAALSSHIRDDEAATSKSFKKLFARPRPFQVDKTLRPVCTLTTEPNSFPSGHTLSGYLLAFTLVQIIPEKKTEILQRADEYANNRIVCGVHYPSDLKAGRELAYLMFGSMLANPRFQTELTAAREETRTNLGLASTATNLE